MTSVEFFYICFKTHHADLIQAPSREKNKAILIEIQYLCRNLEANEFLTVSFILDPFFKNQIDTEKNN